VTAGTKTTTCRTRRYGAAGDEFEVEDTGFVLTQVDAMLLGRARDTVWRDEGMDSPEEFERTWAENHPTRGFRDSDTVWVHRFRRA
jgi:hypothetical protein